ncbi:MAG TPA: hypothetical protein VD907_06265 [Verrucomicrobiae bacterium]|nr:hypothetical protein [Verrucomicrobiae bacterium]
MPSFDFPSAEEIASQRRSSEDFQSQVQGFLAQVKRDMVSRKGDSNVAGYLLFPPGTSPDVREAVCDAINAVNGGQDWDAQLSTDEGQPVLIVHKRQG